MNIKRTPVFSFSLFCCLLGLSINFACQKRKEATQEESISPLVSASLPAFHEAVGAPIPAETGKRWMANLERKNRGTVVPYFIVGSQEIVQLMNDTTCVGLCLYYNLDQVGNTHLALIGVNSAGNALRKETVATDAGSVSWVTFQVNRKAYKAAYPGAIEAHFFGKLTFIRLIEEQQTEAIKAIQALNDEGEPQLLLTDASLTHPTTFEDESGVCPGPNCAQNIDQL